MTVFNLMIASFLRSHGISHGRTALGNTITVAYYGTGNTDVKSQNISSQIEVEVIL